MRWLWYLVWMNIRAAIAMSRSSSAQCSRSQARTEGGSEAGKEDVFLMEGERERERGLAERTDRGRRRLKSEDRQVFRVLAMLSFQSLFKRSGQVSR